MKKKKEIIMEKVKRLVTPNRQHAKIPAPQVPTADTLKNPRLTFADVAGEVLVTYCPETCSGGIYHRSAEIWRIYSPISPREFINAFQQQGFKLPSDFVKAAWMSETGADHVQ